MKRNVSLSYKVLAIMLLLVMFVCSLVMGLLLYQAANQERQLNQQLLARDITRYYQLSTLLNDRLSVWVEGLKHLHTSPALSNQELITTLQRAEDFLLLQWDVNNLWLIDAKQSIIYFQGENLPDEIKPIVAQTLKEARPFYEVHCRVICEQFVSVPLMVDQQTTNVVVMSTSLQELLALLSEATQSNLVLVKYAINQQTQAERYTINSMVSEKQERFMRDILAAFPASGHKDVLLSNGYEVNVQGKAFLVTLLPLYTHQPNGHYLMFAHDIDERKKAYKSQNRIIFWGGIGLVLTFVLCMLVLLKRYAHKLTALSNMLPLLAQKRFKEFKEQQKKSFSSKKWLLDELDTLGDAAVELSDKLESMDKQMSVDTAKLEKMAMFDSLTGLPNRNMMTFQVNKQLAALGRQHVGLALLFIDLDNFKKVNDSHGHHFGDEVVKVASERLSRVIRENDLIARFGGDEFVILVTGLEHENQVNIVAQKLTDEFVEPMVISEQSFYISISIGIAYTTSPKTRALELMRQADTAMYEAKLERGSSYCFFNPSMNHKIVKQVELESEARVALKEHQFFLALQPQIDLSNNRLSGFEALLRWRHPQRGLVPPGDFLPLLENTSMMTELDFWVMEHAIELLSKLEKAGYNDVKMAINLSAAQFANSALQPYLMELIDLYSVNPKNIELELTETVLVADIERAVAVIQQIRALGCKIAVDDFGTGYSSLSYLKMIPSDIIKIDRSFIAGMLETESDRNIVSSTINMVGSMGLEVVAEGIEQAQQLKELGAMQCQYGQGYYISKPIDESLLWNTLESKIFNGRWLV
ncbi:bifunctional diguanylate cyclase/phosphodiesterase [Alteromonas lipolytica]|uniref:Diguanylate cyclase n=1 Tax=Alteromonas lipolytica TaxID=1856405 RepID=A0A1E8FHK6_9ALTE|nr:EAL domain-containing protein [Alteromonas lipolytica]OFI35411.1 hypothetical protein BFC17_11615 [Alteromonas lipolytica]GGF76073.1 hypothetical protein GCM10011338_30250 [Alteromonas lipolytica]